MPKCYFFIIYARSVLKLYYVNCKIKNMVQSPKNKSYLKMKFYFILLDKMTPGAMNFYYSKIPVYCINKKIIKYKNTCSKHF